MVPSLNRCSQNQRQSEVSLANISLERRVSCSRCADLPASSHLCTAPPSTPTEIFLFLHKNASACFPSPRTVWTSFSCPKRRKSLALVEGGENETREIIRKWCIHIPSRMNQLNTAFIWRASSQSRKNPIPLFFSLLDSLTQILFSDAPSVRPLPFHFLPFPFPIVWFV